MRYDDLIANAKEVYSQLYDSLEYDIEPNQGALDAVEAIMEHAKRQRAAIQTAAREIDAAIQAGRPPLQSTLDILNNALDMG